MPEFYLRHIGLNSKDCMQITASQFEDIEYAATILNEALYLEQKYDFVVENYLEFEESLVRCGLEHMIFPDALDSSFLKNMALFNRRVMNLLTTYRTYDDSFRQHLNRIFLRDDAIIEKAELLFSSQYDTRVGYFIVPNLRNFIQHQGFPVHGTSYGSKWVFGENRDDLFNRFSIGIFLNPSELLKSEKFNAQTKTKLRTLKENLDLRFLIRDFMEGFSASHAAIREMLKERVEWASEFLYSAEEEFLSIMAQRNGKSSAMLLACSKEDGRPSVQTGQGAKDHRLYLIKKNKELTNLSKRIMSNGSD